MYISLGYGDRDLLCFVDKLAFPNLPKYYGIVNIFIEELSILLSEDWTGFRLHVGGLEFEGRLVVQPVMGIEGGILVRAAVELTELSA